MNEIAIIGWQNKKWNIDAQHFKSNAEFSTLPIQEKSFPIYILRSSDKFEELENFLQSLPLQRGFNQIILVGGDKFNPKELLPLLHRFPIVSILDSKDENRVEDLLNAMLLTQRLEEQQQTHQKLLREEESRQEKQYQNLLKELSEQQKHINEIQTRLISSLQQEKLLHDTLLIIMTSQGLGEIEVRLQDTLAPLLGPIHLRILLHQGSAHPQNWAPPAIYFELHEQDKTLGKFIVHPIENQTFGKRELKLLENISEAIALHIPRFLAFEANSALETEWRSTFDAISDPLILVNEKFTIIEANRAARSRFINKDFRTSPCYKLLFNRQEPCHFCRFGHKGNIEENAAEPGEIWEMSSHELHHKTNKQRLFIHLYRNKFEQIEMENRISSLAQSAEVGIFKASLAHELNNPIGGLLTLAQLQKMDLPVNHPLFDLVSEIEKQALLCRDLIQDLLQRARPQENQPVINTSKQA